MKRFDGSVPLVLVALLGLALASCSNPAEGVPEAEVSEPGSDSSSAAAPQGIRLVVGGESKIEFVGSKITGSHDGGFSNFEGEINLVDHDPAKSGVMITIDTTSLWSDNERLTGHLKSADFFEVDQYPTATFRSTAIVPSASGYDVTGDLELHGVTKSITFPATISVDGDRVSAQAEFFVKRFDFGIEYPGKPDDLIRDEVVIRFNLDAAPAG